MIRLNTTKILVPLDFSETSLHALRQGALMTKQSKGDLILLHVQKKMDYTDIILPAVGVREVPDITLQLEEKLEQLGESIRKEFGIDVTTMVSSGNVTSEIVNIASEYHAGMIVMGTRGADSHNDLFLGSNAYKTLTKSTIPVLTVRSEAKANGFAEILLPIDSSEHSRQKVKGALMLAAQFASAIYVLGLLGFEENNYEYKLETILKQIEKLAAEENLACHTEILKTDHRAQATLGYAKKISANLIITMEDEKTELTRSILSTYAHELINNATVPVLSIPPEVHVEYIEQDSIGGMW